MVMHEDDDNYINIHAVHPSTFYQYHHPPFIPSLHQSMLTHPYPFIHSLIYPPFLPSTHPTIHLSSPIHLHPYPSIHIHPPIHHPSESILSIHPPTHLHHLSDVAACIRHKQHTPPAREKKHRAEEYNRIRRAKRSRDGRPG